MKFFRLLFTGIINLIYNLGLAAKEAATFGRYHWWWQLRGWLFLVYLIESPFAVIKREGPRAPVAMQNLIYGETPCLTMRAIIERIAPKPNDHFIDLGCGRGLTVFFVNRYFNIAATGIEVIPSFVRRAQRLAKRFKQNVEFRRENLSWVTLDDIGRGTIFYLAGSAFEDSLLTKITARLELLPAGVKLITLSEPFPSDQFRVMVTERYHFTWGSTEVYFHEKIC